MQELLRARPAHRPGHGRHDHVLESEAGEDPLVGVALGLVGGLQARVVDVETVGVLHDELAPAYQAGARARLVAVLRLDLVQSRGQILVRGVHVLHQQGEHLLVGGGQQVVPALAVGQFEQGGPVVLPPVRRLVGLSGDQPREVDLLGAHAVHLLADDPLDLAQRAQSQGQPRVDPGRGPPDIARAHEQLMGVDLGVRRVLAQRAQEECRVVSQHGPRVGHRADAGETGPAVGAGSRRGHRGRRVGTPSVGRADGRDRDARDGNGRTGHAARLTARAEPSSATALSGWAR